MSTDPNKNIFKRGQVFWLEARIDGHKVKESLRTDDLIVARRARDRRLDELRAIGGVKRKWNTVVAEWLSWWRTKKNRSDDTTQRYLVSLGQCQEFLENYNIDKIDGKIILKLIEARKEKGVEESTIRRDLTAVSAVLKFAENKNWREGNPAVAKRNLLEENNEPIVLPTQSEIDAILAQCSPCFAALVEAARLTGCRQNELVTVRWDQFADNRRTLTVVGKRNKRRTIDLSEAAHDLIRRQPRVEGSDLIFCKEDGEAFAQAASDFTHIRRAANKDRKRPIDFRFHDLRHLYAVESLHAGMSIYRLQKQLGHTTIKITERYLEFLSPEEMEQAQRGEVMAFSGAPGDRHGPQAATQVGAK